MDRSAILSFGIVDAPDGDFYGDELAVRMVVVIHVSYRFLSPATPRPDQPTLMLFFRKVDVSPLSELLSDTVGFFNRMLSRVAAIAPSGYARYLSQRLVSQLRRESSAGNLRAPLVTFKSRFMFKKDVRSAAEFQRLRILFSRVAVPGSVRLLSDRQPGPFACGLCWTLDDTRDPNLLGDVTGHLVPDAWWVHSACRHSFHRSCIAGRLDDDGYHCPTCGRRLPINVYIVTWD